MITLFIKFQNRFAFFLAKDKQNNWFQHSLNRKTSVKDIIESFGVPHAEIGHLYFNGKEIDFSYIPFSNGSLEVYAIQTPFSVLSPSFLRPEPFDRIKFIADVNVIRLGRLLILSGFDVVYSSFYSDHEIADIAQIEHRIVLTRDTALLKRKKIVFAKRIRENMPYDQLVEVIEFFGLKNAISLFSKCTSCNAHLEIVEKKNISHLLEPKTKQYFHTFFQCPQCKNVFWRGSHHEKIQKTFSSLGILKDS